jgi:hypothetical protein
MREGAWGSLKIQTADPQPVAEGSGFTLHLFRHVWRTLRIAATGTESLALVGTGQRAGRGREEEEASVVGPHRAEDAFVREAFGGGDTDPELDRDLGSGEPPGLMEMLYVPPEMKNSMVCCPRSIRNSHEPRQRHAALLERHAAL